MLVLLAATFAVLAYRAPADDHILAYTVDPQKQDLQLYWKDDKGEILGSIQRLKTYVESRGQVLTFAMNGGMFNPDYSPQGLFIQRGETKTPLDTGSGNGNFYLKPNGVFYLTTRNVPAICTTSDFADKGNVRFATQSGPMLVVNGQIHPAFTPGSANLNIRNGVGILPGNKVVFAMSETPVNFYDFALYFQRLGCKNALYLDGYVCRTYLPEQQWTQLDGHFGVMIGVTKKAGKR